MKFHYYLETDSLYIELAERASADSREAADGIVLDFDSEGRLVGIDVDNASRTLNLDSLEIHDLHFNSLAITAAVK